VLGLQVGSRRLGVAIVVTLLVGTGSKLGLSTLNYF
jgi:hypothetical protein